jgi:hypothetical protein
MFLCFSLDQLDPIAFETGRQLRPWGIAIRGEKQNGLFPTNRPTEDLRKAKTDSVGLLTDTVTDMASD